MTTPVLVITGFLGAGKTTLINAFLAKAGGRRIAAIVNDFGAINIDEDLIDASADTIVGLSNGCICCTMQGDLLRTLKILLSRDPVPDQIVIEASGVADPSGIVQALADPVLWKSARLDAVLCVIDAQDVTETPERRADTLWQAQLAAAHFVVLSKSGRLSTEEVAELSAALSPSGKPLVFDSARETLPDDLVFGANGWTSGMLAADASAPLRTDRFVKLEWEVPEPVALEPFQRLIAGAAPMFVRAKGIVQFLERPGASYILQMVGRRVTLERAKSKAVAGCRLVFIGEAGQLESEHLRVKLDGLARASLFSNAGGDPIAHFGDQ